MTKDEILNMLRSASAPISGEEMSRALGVSRAAVWKAVDQLRQEGYAIEAATRRGYRLAALPDRLDAAVIAGDTGADVHVYEEVTSTNTVARQLAADGWSRRGRASWPSGRPPARAAAGAASPPRRADFISASCSAPACCRSRSCTSRR